MPLVSSLLSSITHIILTKCSIPFWKSHRVFSPNSSCGASQCWTECPVIRGACSWCWWSQRAKPLSSLSVVCQTLVWIFIPFLKHCNIGAVLLMTKSRPSNLNNSVKDKHALTINITSVLPLLQLVRKHTWCGKQAVHGWVEGPRDLVSHGRFWMLL